MKPLFRLASIAVLGSCIVAAAPVMAQSNQQAPSQAPAQEQDFSQETLQNYVDAQTDMQEIRREFTQQAQQTSDEAEINEMRQSANEELVEAVKDNGLTVEEFTQINQAVQSDPALAQQVQEMQQ